MQFEGPVTAGRSEVSHSPWQAPDSLLQSCSDGFRDGGGWDDSEARGGFADRHRQARRRRRILQQHHGVKA